MSSEAKEVIEVRLFATFREYLPPGSNAFSFTRELSGQTTVSEIVAELKLPTGIPKIVLINGTHTTESQALHGGDVLSIFPPIAGG